VATLFFSRDGKDPNRSNQGHELPIDPITQFFQKHDHHYFSKPPGINSHLEPSLYSTYTNVVVEIHENETNEKFTKPGYYWFHLITPKDCQELTDLPELG
jgi:hypothetical protein